MVLADRGRDARPPAAAQPAKASAAVKIDFRALTDDGQQVSDLKAEEITLKVNGKPRQIQSLGVFHTAAAADPSPGGSALPPPYATNAVGRNGRVIHVLIDDDSITPGREGQMQGGHAPARRRSWRPATCSAC